jgi:hypothetical protein
MRATAEIRKPEARPSDRGLLNDVRSGLRRFLGKN